MNLIPFVGRYQLYRTDVKKQQIFFLNKKIKNFVNSSLLTIEIMKLRLLLFLIIGIFMSCESNSKKWYYASGGYGNGTGELETVDQFISEFGEPVKINSMELFLSENVTHRDMFNPEYISNEEITKMHKEYVYINSWGKGSIREPFMNPKLSSRKRYKIENEIESRKTKFAKIKTTEYLETNENRLKREKELGFKFSSFRYVGFTSPELPNMGGTEYFYEYQFDLGKSTYGKEYPDDDNPDLPPNTKIILTGNLYLDSEFNIVSTSDGMTYSLSLCDCLTKSEFSNVGACEIKFYDRYGTISPSSEQMEKDYFDCK